MFVCDSEAFLWLSALMISRAGYHLNFIVTAAGAILLPGSIQFRFASGSCLSPIASTV